MGVRVLHDQQGEGIACLYDSVSGLAFGPIFTGPNAEQEADAYTEWLREKGPAPKRYPEKEHDARLYDQDEHWKLVGDFKRSRERAS